MFRSLPSRIQLSEREVYQTLQQVLIDRAVRQQLETWRLNEMTSDLPYCHLRGTSPASPPSSMLTLTSPSSSSSSSGIICTPSDSEGDELDRNLCVLAASTPSPRNSSPPLPLSFYSTDHQAPARQFHARLNGNHRVRDGDGGRESTATFEDEDDIGHGSPPEQGPLAQTLPNPRYRIRRVVGSGHHGAFV